MKRLSIALAAIGLSAGALAAIPAGTDPTEVMVPQLPGGFVIGVTGFYLQGAPTDGDLDYVVVNTGTTSPFFSRFRDVDPGYDWGWGINAGYIFPGTPYDVNVNYMHWSSRDTDHTIIPLALNPANQNVFITNPNAGGFDALGFSPAFINIADARAEYTLNLVDLTAGEYVFLGCRTILHPFMGLRWADLERKLRTHESAPNTVPVPTAGTRFASGGFIDIFEKSDFDGVGPIFGVDTSFYIAYGLGVVGHFDTAMLVGNTRTKTDTTVVQNEIINTTGTIVTVTQFNNFRGDSDRRIVPVIDAKLGGSYTFVFNNASNSDLTLEAGWQVSNYFNAIDRLTVSIPNSSITKRETSNFSFQGPYINLTFHA